MPGYQPRHDTDPVWWNGAQLNDLDIASTGIGVRITALYGWDDRPDVRDTRELRSGQDGERADNLFLGGRTLTIEGEVYGSSWSDLQARKRELSGYFLPTTTEVLVQVPDPSTASPTTVYADGMSGYERMTGRVIEAIQFGDTLDPMCQVFQVIVRCADPRRYVDTQEVLETTDISTGGGRSYRKSYPKDYGEAQPGGSVEVQNSGTMSAPWVARVYGPVTNPIVEDSNDLGQIVFEGLTIPSGDYVEIDSLERTATLNGDSDQSRFQFIDFELSSWWLLPVGSSTIRLRGSTVSDPASLQIRFRPASI